MRRRELVLLLGGAMTAARALRAQQRATPVIGFLSSGSPGPYASSVVAFREGLSETGHVEGQNLAIEYRWAEGRYDELPTLAAELVGRKVDVIAASGDPVPALQQKTQPRKSRSCSSPAMRSGTGWSPAWPVRAAISRASASSLSS